MGIPANALITKVGDNINADLGEGGLIAMNIDLGRYYQLNAVAARILDRLETPQTKQGLVELICSEFDVTREDCLQDTEQFLQRLLELGLIRITEAPSG